MPGSPPPRSADPAPITIARRVRFGDCDPAGIVFTPRYAEFVFDAAEIWLERVMGLPVHAQLAGTETATPVRSISVDLRLSLRPGESFACQVFVEAIGRTSFRLLVVGRRGDGRLSFVGRMTCVATDRSRRVTEPLSPAYRAVLTDYQARSGTPPGDAGPAALDQS
jgi:4-hydroxybenzoyl-CoA thioesterase